MTEGIATLTCQKCNGTGRVNYGGRPGQCNNCGGKGEVTEAQIQDNITYWTEHGESTGRSPTAIETIIREQKDVLKKLQQISAVKSGNNKKGAGDPILDFVIDEMIEFTESGPRRNAKLIINWARMLRQYRDTIQKS